MSSSNQPTTDRTAHPTTPAAFADDDCGNCGTDLPCFDHFPGQCANGRYACDGPRSENACPACRRAFRAGGRF